MTKTLSTEGLLQINEQIEDWRSDDLLIDRENHLIKNIALTGMKSKNGYHYSEKSLKNALSLYENKPVFLDHASNLTKPYDRSTRDLVGSVVNPRFEKNRVRGDIRILETEAGKTFLALVQSNAPSVGMSQVVMGERGKDPSIIEKIHDVVSVDAVIFPATTTTFREQQKNKKSESHPAPIEELEKKVQRLSEEIKAVIQEKEELLSQIENLEKENQEFQLQEWIREQSIPESLLTKAFFEQLSNAGSDEERTSLLEDRLIISRSCFQKYPTSSERFITESDGSFSDDSIVSIIKRA
jgi:hypothetical protein